MLAGLSSPLRKSTKVIPKQRKHQKDNLTNPNKMYSPKNPKRLHPMKQTTQHSNKKYHATCISKSTKQNTKRTQTKMAASFPLLTQIQIYNSHGVNRQQRNTRYPIEEQDWHRGAKRLHHPTKHNQSDRNHPTMPHSLKRVLWEHDNPNTTKLISQTSTTASPST